MADSGGDERFVLDNDLLVTGSAIVQGSLAVRALGACERIAAGLAHARCTAERAAPRECASVARRCSRAR
jgi:hypothetical protein